MNALCTLCSFLAGGGVVALGYLIDRLRSSPVKHS